jgi:protein-L-isoaspartate(D-aspartate) O-methyltransferase
MAPVLANRSRERSRLVESIAARGVTDPAVLSAMERVPREAFVPTELAEFAYRDVALPIEAEQTISQPYVVALMTEALQLDGRDRVLEIGTGSGYAAGVLAHVAGEVFTVERHGELAGTARERLASLGVHNVTVHHGDGRYGWPDYAPYDAIVVTAAADVVPQRLRAQVRFVPLLPGKTDVADDVAGPRAAKGAPAAVAAACEPFTDLERVNLDGLLRRIGSARLVLLGEASHGSSEFYRMRQRITRELIERAGFGFVAVEADWPDAALVDAYVRGASGDTAAEEPVRAGFRRFPQWMWRNAEVLAFVEWLREYNRDPNHDVGFHGLDLYSMHDSIQQVIDYLDGVDPELAETARRRYACLTPYEADPTAYGLAALNRAYEACEHDVVSVLQELCRRRGSYRTGRGEEFLDAEQNAVVARDAERYYRAMYYGGEESWNVRDRHMMSTLRALMMFHGPAAKGVVWAHNSHLGDARATAMSSNGQVNVGQLVREEYGTTSYNVGFGTDHGTVMAAPAWGGKPRVMEVQPGRARSYEQLFHQAEPSAFLLPLRRRDADAELRRSLARERLERAIGVVYRPQNELASHYVGAVLPEQFDEYIWFDSTSAVTPLSVPADARTNPRHPFTTLDT